MRGANILAVVAVFVWFGLALIGLSLVRGVVEQNVPGYPSNGQIQFLVLIPIGIAALLITCTWLCNRFMRRPPLLGCISGAALLAVLPYLLGLGGGV
jgi:hypothetical protein